MNESAKGIIVSSLDYKENDCILHVVSDTHGLLSFVVRGAKKKQSKRSGTIQVGNVCTFHFDYKDKGLLTLKQMDFICYYPNVFQDLQKQAIAFVIFEYYQKLVELPLYAFEHILSYMEVLEHKDFDIYVLFALYNEMFETLGIELQVDACTVCGSINSIQNFLVSAGGFICSNCNDTYSSYGFNELKEIRILAKGKLEHIEIVSRSIEEPKKYLSVFYEFFRSYAGIQIRSFRFLNELLLGV